MGNVVRNSESRDFRAWVESLCNNTYYIMCDCKIIKGKIYEKVLGFVGFGGDGCRGL